MNRIPLCGKRKERILVHYYSAINIRHRGTISNVRVTPDYRWNPLNINWNTSNNRPPILAQGASHQIGIQIENASIFDWNCPARFANISLRYRWFKDGYGEQVGSNQVSVCNLAKARSSGLLNITVVVPYWGAGWYKLSFDIQGNTQYESFWFSEQNPGWPNYNVYICVNGPCNIYLPMVTR